MEQCAETLTVGDDLTFEVRRGPRRETLGITVDRDGSLVLSLPDDCPLEEGRAFAEERQFWIFTKLAEKKLLRRPTGPKRYVEGEGHYYLGRSYRLKLIDDAGPDVPPLRLYQGRWRLRTDEGKHADEHFRFWYVSRGQDYVEGRVEQYANRLEVDPVRRERTPSRLPVGIVQPRRHTQLPLADRASSGSPCRLRGGSRDGTPPRALSRRCLLDTGRARHARL